MATIRAFKGTRYSAEDISALVAPPYDVISESERAGFAAQSPHNVVFLTLPEQNADDRSKYIKYARSASRLEEWLRNAVIQVEDKPTFYRLKQTFKTPYGDEFTRTALIATIKVEPYENGVVLPHEQTFPKHKEDRLRILEATKSHLECIFGLFEDPDRSILGQIDSANVVPMSDVTTDDGVRHVVEGIKDEATIKKLEAAFETKKVWIADGHHRYETALNFRQMQPEGGEPIAEDFLMMALSSMEDPGLVLLPTHRILKRVEGDIRERLKADYWTMEDCPNADLMSKIESIQAAGQRAFGVALPGGNGFVLVIPELDKVLAEIKTECSNELKSLDVTILHEVIFAKHLGLTGLDFFGYTRDPKEAVEAVEAGAPGAFLMNPPSVQDMGVIANGGEKMPQKSTYYYPKIISGLVMWRLKDF